MIRQLQTIGANSLLSMRTFKNIAQLQKYRFAHAPFDFSKHGFFAELSKNDLSCLLEQKDAENTKKGDQSCIKCMVRIFKRKEMGRSRVIGNCKAKARRKSENLAQTIYKQR